MDAKFNERVYVRRRKKKRNPIIMKEILFGGLFLLIFMFNQICGVAVTEIVNNTTTKEETSTTESTEQTNSASVSLYSTEEYTTQEINESKLNSQTQVTELIQAFNQTQRSNQTEDFNSTKINYPVRKALDAPYHAHIKFDTYRGNILVCCATIVGTRTLLTAAYCFDPTRYEVEKNYTREEILEISFAVAGLTTDDDDGMGQWRTFIQYIDNGNFIHDTKVIKNDIALLFIEGSWIFSPVVKAIHIFSSDEDLSKRNCEIATTKIAGLVHYPHAKIKSVLNSAENRLYYSTVVNTTADPTGNQTQNSTSQNSNRNNTRSNDTLSVNRTSTTIPVYSFRTVAPTNNSKETAKTTNSSVASKLTTAKSKREVTTQNGVANSSQTLRTAATATEKSSETTNTPGKLTSVLTSKLTSTTATSAVTNQIGVANSSQILSIAAEMAYEKRLPVNKTQVLSKVNLMTAKECDEDSKKKAIHHNSSRILCIADENNLTIEWEYTGGPLVCYFPEYEETAELGILVGILSQQAGKTDNTSFVTKVAAHAPWIKLVQNVARLDDNVPVSFMNDREDISKPISQSYRISGYVTHVLVLNVFLYVFHA